MRLRTERVGCDTSAVAALEFALVLPVMMLLVIGAVDICKALVLWQQVYNAAHGIPISATIVSVQPDKTTSLTAAQAQQQMSAIYAEMPWVRDGLEVGQKSVTMSSVAFVPIAGCQQGTDVNCYTPTVMWTIPYFGGVIGSNDFQPLSRPCGPVLQIKPLDPAPPMVAGVPSQLLYLRTKDVMQPDPILVVDVHYRYTPFLWKFATGSFDFWATGYIAVRSVDPNALPTDTYTKYVPDANGGLCS